MVKGINEIEQLNAQLIRELKELDWLSLHTNEWKRQHRGQLRMSEQRIRRLQYHIEKETNELVKSLLERSGF